MLALISLVIMVLSLVVFALDCHKAHLGGRFRAGDVAWIFVGGINFTFWSFVMLREFSIIRIVIV